MSSASPLKRLQHSAKRGILLQEASSSAAHLLQFFSSRDRSKRSRRFYVKQQFNDNKSIPSVWPEVTLLSTTSQIIFPQFSSTIRLRDSRLMNIIRQNIIQNQPYAGVFLKRNAFNNSEVVMQLQDIHTTGTFVHIRQIEDFHDHMILLLHAIRRISIAEYLAISPVLTVQVVNVTHQAYTKTMEVKAITQELVKTLRDIITINPMNTEILQQMLQENHNVLQDTIYLCDLGASIAVDTPSVERQAVLEERDVTKRLMLSLSMLKKALELTQLQHRIGQEVDENVKRMHRKFMLTEQIKVIKKELGIEKDDRHALSEKFRDRLLGKRVPAVVLETINEEMKKLKMIEGHSIEFNVVRNYLDWLTALPWGISTTERLSIERAFRILNKMHYGMPEVKTRILEFIAVSQLRSSTQGKILCFYGPSGVGKTSIAWSIARALNRRYYRFSVGGLTNVAEIKGHRRTYVGAMPGKLVQCLKQTGTENPVVLIDEIDKIGTSIADVGAISGSPTAALLELLDAEQNNNFMDFFLDVPVDLSKVLFICTANAVEGIPPALRDRMELIEMTGYVDVEKFAIAREHLLPKALSDSGICPEQIHFTDNALTLLIRKYCAESGVRNLQKMLEKIIRKVAYQMVKSKKETKPPVTITELSLANFLGKSTVQLERMYSAATPPGVAMGLAYTVNGGSVVFIEIQRQGASQTDTNLLLTGSLGTVMRESAEIALTVARNHLPSNELLHTGQIHIHVPEGAQPKDGPSAGVTIVTALESLALNREVRPHMAMTGEVSLNGRILPVKGIKEKAIAAKRMGVRWLILPAENRKDYEALPKHITVGMEVHFVKDYAEVHRIVFESD